MYVGDLCVGMIVFHAKWGLGRVVRVDSAYVVTRHGKRRHKLAMNDSVAVWVASGAGEQANITQGRAA